MDDVSEGSRFARMVPLVFAVACIMWLLASPALAQPSPTAQAEIDHLLDFVATSSCTFVRNGDGHPAAEAREHLQGKLRFAGSRISTADEFIKYIATGSSVSGDAYHVRCGTTDMLAGVWLADELKRYRAVAQAPRRP